MERCSKWCWLAAGSLVCMIGAGQPAAASQFKKTVKGQLKGAWVVLKVEAWSGCGGSYTDNRVSSGNVASSGDLRFAVGELGKIDGVQVKRSRIDLKIELAEPVLVPYVDGPFELLDERVCRVEMEVEVPRQLMGDEDVAAVLERVGGTVELHTTLADARGSDLWNERQRAPYPPDYELTLARHARWQAETINVAVSERTRRAHEDAVRLTGRIDDDPEYLQGFAAGAEKMRSWWERDCDDLIIAEFRSERDRPPSDRSSAWDAGWDDGQELVFNVVLAERLEGCYVPVPELPADAEVRP